jgi:hypothetical protein
LFELFLLSKQVLPEKLFMWNKSPEVKLQVCNFERFPIALHRHDAIYVSSSVHENVSFSTQSSMVLTDFVDHCQFEWLEKSYDSGSRDQWWSTFPTCARPLVPSSTLQKKKKKKKKTYESVISLFIYILIIEISILI